MNGSEAWGTKLSIFVYLQGSEPGLPGDKLVELPKKIEEVLGDRVDFIGIREEPVNEKPVDQGES